MKNEDGIKIQTVAVKKGNSAISKAAYERWKSPEFRDKMQKIWDTPEYKEKLSIKSKEKWVDARYRERVKPAMDAARNDPEYKANLSKKAKLKWEDPEYRAKQTKLMQEARASQEVRDKIAKGIKEVWSTPQHKEKMAKAMEHVYKDPVYRKNRSDIAKRMWANPEHRKLMKEQRTARALKQWEDPIHREKMSLNSKQRWEDIEFRESRTGPNNHMWKGGVACGSYCPVWSDVELKKMIKERDNYKCQNPDCWHKCDDKLDVHHIDYDKKQCHPTNLITLCKSCNARANTKRSIWKELYENIMKTKFKKNGVTKRRRKIIKPISTENVMIKV